MKLRLAMAVMLTIAPLGVSEARVGMRKFTEAEARQAAKFMGECTVKREHDLARGFVMAGGDWKALNVRRDRIVQNECLPKSNMVTLMTNDAYAGAIAEALIHADGVGTPSASAVASSALTYPEPTPVRTTDKSGQPLSQDKIDSQNKGIERRMIANNRLRLGECIVRHEAALSRGILDTQLDTPSELAAIKALVPAMTQCLPSGQTVGFDRATLRNAIAVAVYRLSQAPAANGANS